MAKTLDEINAEFQNRVQRELPETAEEAEELVESDNSGDFRPKRKPAAKCTKNASLASDIIFYITLAVMVLCAVLFSRNGMSHSMFGSYQYYEVLTTSMQSVYPRGSFVLVKTVNTDTLEIGDDITYFKDSSTTITHRIVNITENYNSSGNRGFITKGIENAEPDSGIVDERNVVGLVIWHMPYLGALLTWFSENLWMLLLIFGSLLACSFFLKMFYREASGFFRKGVGESKQPSSPSGEKPTKDGTDIVSRGLKRMKSLFK